MYLDTSGPLQTILSLTNDSTFRESCRRRPQYYVLGDLRPHEHHRLTCSVVGRWDFIRFLEYVFVMSMTKRCRPVHSWTNMRLFFSDPFLARSRLLSISNAIFRDFRFIFFSTVLRAFWEIYFFTCTYGTRTLFEHLLAAVAP